MYKMAVKGELQSMGCREGSSGIFTGSIEGLYQGYRFGSSQPDVQNYVIEAPNGTIALVLTQQIVTQLPSRLAVHPWEGGKNPLSEPLPPGFPQYGPPGSKSPQGTAAPPAGAEHGNPFDHSKRIFYMQVTLRADPEKSTGIFAGATGEIELQTPAYRMSGYLIVKTKQGDLRMTFLEAGEKGALKADLQVDGANSTGIYHNATGNLKFAQTSPRPMFSVGPYEGTIWLENEPQS